MDSALSNFKHRLMDVGNGVKLNTITGGSGQPLFLLHGFPQTWQEWKPVMPELAKKYTVVAVDLKGCGQSDKPVGGYDKVTMAGELDQLREKLGFGSVYVAGHDIGGMVAYAWAATRRPSVSKIAILDITIPGVSFWDQLFVDSRAWHYGFFMKRDLPEKLLAGQEFAFIDHFIRDRVYNQGAFSDSDIQMFANGFAKPGAMRGCLEWYRAFEKDAADNRALSKNKLEIPVLALGGEHRWGDKMVGIMQEFASDVRGGPIKDSGHYIVEEQPQLLLKELMQFFG
jgi:pimeloyl-ACP methyl ester carboxylesterase